MTDLLRSEIFRLRKRRMPYVLLLILLATVAGIYVLLWATIEASPTDTDTDDLEDMLLLEQAATDGMSLGQGFAVVMIVILAGTLVASEYGWGTIRTILPRSAGRDQFLAAKLITLVIYSVITTLVTYIAVVGSSAVVTSLGGFDSDPGDSFVTDSLLAIAQTWYTMLPYLALAFMLAVLFRSTAAGIGIGLGVYFTEDIVASLVAAGGGAGERISEVFLTRNVVAVMQANSDDPAVDFSPWRAVVVLAIYTTVFLAVAFWRFRSRDVQTG